MLTATPHAGREEDFQLFLALLDISWDEHEGENAAHELILVLDQEQCVNFYRRRDYCDDCFEPVWRAMNTLIGVDDPYVERDREHEYE